MALSKEQRANQIPLALAQSGAGPHHPSRKAARVASLAAYEHSLMRVPLKLSLLRSLI
jgi:hypothetical protein